MDRRKRQKVSHCPNPEEEAPKQKNLLDLPTEVLLMILRSIANNELAKTVRTVARKLNDLCSDILRRDFYCLEKRIKLDIDKHLKQLLPGTCSGLLRSYQLSLSIWCEYNLTMATVWRYVYCKRNMTMIAGSIIDDIQDFLNTPITLREKQTVEYIRNECKKFQDYFEDHIERPKNKFPHFSGSRLIDILDCMLTDTPNNVASKIVNQNFVDNEGFYVYESIYNIPYAWFSCLDPGKETAFHHRSRNFFHFMRRIICKHNYQSSRNAALYFNGTVQDDKFEAAPLRFWFRALHYGTSVFYGLMNRTFHDHMIDQDGEETNEIPVLQVKVSLRCNKTLAPKAAIEMFENRTNNVNDNSASWDSIIEEPDENQNKTCTDRGSFGETAVTCYSTDGMVSFKTESVHSYSEDEDDLANSRSDESVLSDSSSSDCSHSNSTAESSGSNITIFSNEKFDENEKKENSPAPEREWSDSPKHSRRYRNNDVDHEVLPSKNPQKLPSKKNPSIVNLNNSLFKMTLSITCPLSMKGRLPHYYKCEFK